MQRAGSARSIATALVAGTEREASPWRRGGIINKAVGVFLTKRNAPVPDNITLNTNSMTGTSTS